MYNPTKWQDHVADPENEYIIEQIEGDRYKIIPCGTTIQKGTLLSAVNFNKAERGISETVSALGALLQFASLINDRSSEGNNLFFITDEYSVSMSEFIGAGGIENGLITMRDCIFSDENKRKNSNYIVVPIITDVKFYIDGDAEYTGLKQVCTPTIIPSEKSLDGFTIKCICPYRESDFKSMTYRFLIIGGV